MNQKVPKLHWLFAFGGIGFIISLMPAPLKLLLVCYDYPPRMGGVATCSVNLATALSKQKEVSLTLMAPQQPGMELWDAQVPYPVRRVSLSQKTSLATFQFFFLLKRTIAELKPDAILHLLWFPSGVASLLITALDRQSPPYFLLTHGLEVMESNRTLKKRLRKSLSFVKRWTFENSQQVFAVSQYTKDLVIRETLISPQKVAISPNGVDPAQFNPQTKNLSLLPFRWSEDDFIFGSCCRLVPHKGLVPTLKAIKRLVESGQQAQRNVIYLIAGDGPQRDLLIREVELFGLTKRVFFLGALKQNQLKDFYNTIDCFLQLSYEDRAGPSVEGFGITFLEAAACGKISIGGRSGGIPDAIINSETGWLVDPFNEEEVVAQLRWILNHPAEVKRMEQQARNRALVNFSWDHIANQMVGQITGNLHRHSLF